MGKLHTTMRGKQLDMEQLNLKNETIPAVGNMKVNARGDQLGSGGKVIRTREQILGDYYKNNPRAVNEEIVDRKGKN